jgi:hypothetical protein
MDFTWKDSQDFQRQLYMTYYEVLSNEDLKLDQHRHFENRLTVKRNQWNFSNCTRRIEGNLRSVALFI